MPPVGRSKRMCRKIPIQVDGTVRTERCSKNVGGQAHCPVSKVEGTSSHKKQDQEAVNQQTAMEQELCPVEARVKPTISSEALDVGVARTDLGANGTCSTESPNGSRSRIAILTPIDPITQSADETERQMVSCSPVSKKDSEYGSIEPQRTRQTAKRSTGGRRPRHIFPGQTPIRNPPDWLLKRAQRRSKDRNRT